MLVWMPFKTPFMTAIPGLLPLLPEQAA